MNRVESRSGRNPLIRCGLYVLAAAAALTSVPGLALSQAIPGVLVSRAELTARAKSAETASIAGDERSRKQNAVLAATIRARLREGDFQVGDRVVVTIVSDKSRTDTVVVKAGKVLELPDKMVVVVSGVLRSELKEKVSSEVLKYVKASRIEVTPLMRVGILGEVANPGFFALGYDLPITDAIMGAGGPTSAADLGRSIVRRGGRSFRSSEETRKAIAGGLTLDQFGLNAGDELVVGRRRDMNAGTAIGMIGSIAAIAGVFVAIRR